MPDDLKAQGTTGGEGAADKASEGTGDKPTPDTGTPAPDENLLTASDGEGEGEGESGGTKDGDKPGDKPGDAPQDEYGDFDLPEGVTVTEPEKLAEFKGLFKEMGLNKDQAQKLVTMEANRVKAQQEAFKETRKAWVAELKADKEFGGDKFSVTLKDAQMAIRRFDPDGSALKVLGATGLADNPALVKLLARMNRAISEDTIHTGKERNPKTKEKPLYDRLWTDKDMGGV